jgi:hypothetical protein
MYLPRRSTPSTRAPSSAAATSFGSSGRVSRASSIVTFARRRPSSTGASRPRSVSTSGSSGTDRVEDERARFGRAVGDRVRGQEVAGDRVRRLLVVCVDLGERLAFFDPIAALAQADDSHRVVDVVVLLATAGAELERGDADR